MRGGLAGKGGFVQRTKGRRLRPRREQYTENKKKKEEEGKKKLSRSFWRR
jgi:hypothetical protein